MAERETSEPALEQATGWLYRLQQAPGDEALRRAAAAWLAEDAGHLAAWQRVARAWELTGRTAPAFPERWEKRGRSRPAPGVPPAVLGHRPRRAGRRPERWAAALAACLLLVLVVPPLSRSLEAEIVTGPAETRLVALADGSSVELGAESALMTDYGEGSRGVELLEGEAFFQIVPDAARPFLVAAEDLAVAVTGTAFEVAVTDRSLSVSVREGTVEVDGPWRRGAAPVRLQRGERLAFDRRSGALRRTSIDPEAVAAWRHGRLAVMDAPLAEVVELLDRYQRGSILLVGETLGERRVTGVFDLDDPHRALRALLAPYDGEVRSLTPFLLVASPY